MTINNSASRVVCLGNGATTNFAFSFLIPVAGDEYIVYTDASGNMTPLSNTLYTVVGFGNPAGGTVIYPLVGSPIASGTTLTIARIVPLIQPTSINNQGAFYPQVVETALDYLTMEVQQVSQAVSLSISAPIVDNILPKALPPAAQRANQILGFDAQGQPTTFAQGGPLVNVIPVPNGGTGFSSYAIGDMLYADTPSTLAKLSGTTAAGRSLLLLSTAPVALLSSWSAITRPAAFDTFVATPTASNLRALVGGVTGTGSLVFANSPSLTGTATFTSLQYQKTLSAFANVPLYLENLNAQQAVGDAGQMLMVYAQALNQSVVPSDFRLIHNGVTATLVDSGAMRAVAYQLGTADGFTANTQAAHIRAGEFHALRGAGVPDGGKVWALELGVHSEVAAASAQTLMGIYLASSHTGWRPTGVRSGTGILITGEDGWQHGLTYLDTDQTTVLFDIDQNGVLQTKGALVPTVSGAAALGSASKPWSDLYIKANGTLNFGNGDVAINEFADSLNFVGAANGFAFETAVLPTTNGGAILGNVGYGWANLYMASGAVIDFNSGNYKLTHAAGVLTANGVVRVNLNAAALPAPSTGTVLHLSSADGVSTRMTIDNFANAGNIVQRRANGTAASPSALASNDAIGGLVTFGYGTTGYSSGSRGGFTMYADAAWTDTAQQTRIDIITTPAASVTPRVTATFKADGTFDALTALSVNGAKVVGARDTGWTAMTGTPDKATAFATSTVTLAQLAGRVMSLQTALTTHGLIGT